MGSCLFFSLRPHARGDVSMGAGGTRETTELGLALLKPSGSGSGHRRPEGRARLLRVGLCPISLGTVAAQRKAQPVRSEMELDSRSCSPTP